MLSLFITPWYPNRYDAMLGLFVRKHAQAVQRTGVEVHVLTVCYNSSTVRRDFVSEHVEGLFEHTLYCPSSAGRLSQFLDIDRIWNYWHKLYGLPDVVHLNVITKLGLLPLKLKRKYKIPYVITEHWSGYLPENGGYGGGMQRFMYEYIARGAAAVMPVSQKLQYAMQQSGLKNSNWHIVNNVIDDFFSQSNEQSKGDKYRIVHVSCFENRSKNVVGIVEAVNLLAQSRHDFELVMVGTGVDIAIVEHLANRYGLVEKGLMKFVGEQTPLQVKRWMDMSDLFLLFSNYESASIVLSEALACGLPILTTDVGIASEIIDKKSGLLLPIADIDMLAEKLNEVIDGKHTFDIEHIKSKSHLYTFDSVGNQIVDIYNQIL